MQYKQQETKMEAKNYVLLRKMLLENVENESLTRKWADWFYDEFCKRSHKTGSETRGKT